ncbi:MAG: cupin domain-containing protein [Candidatus Dormibacterales bacterium]
MTSGSPDDAGAADSVQVGAVTIRFVHTGPASPYSLIEWIAPPGTPSPPVHIHHQTDEGFYMLSGAFRFLLDGRTIDASAGAHVLVPREHAHTFWNSGREAASCLIVLSPPGFADYFRELASGLAASESDDAAMEVRQELSAQVRHRGHRAACRTWVKARAAVGRRSAVTSRKSPDCDDSHQSDADQEDAGSLLCCGGGGGPDHVQDDPQRREG